MLILLDRDGVINEDRVDYVKSADEFRLIPGVGPSIQRMNALGWKIAVVTNQSCVGKGILSLAQLDAVHAHMRDQLRSFGATIDGIYFAPDHPDRASDRRKPGPGMLLEAMRDFNASPDQSVLIGDALRDLEAAQRVGCRRILVKTGKGHETWQQGLPDHVQPVMLAQDLPDAVEKIATLYSAQKN